MTTTPIKGSSATGHQKPPEDRIPGLPRDARQPERKPGIAIEHRDNKGPTNDDRAKALAEKGRESQAREATLNAQGSTVGVK